MKLQRGGIVNKPTFGMFGERGAEALVPLEKNKKFGENILQRIIPEYYPELMNAEGGIFASPTTSYNYGVGDSYEERYSILGPVNVMAQDPVDFTNKLKDKYRVSPGRR